MINIEILIIDFGSQYTQLIVKKSRKLGRNALVVTFDQFLKNKANYQFQALILSGGPHSLEDDKYRYDLFLQEYKNTPLLGICYGMQIMSHVSGAKVQKGVSGEYGHSELKFEKKLSDYLKVNSANCWMSHFDAVYELPPEYEVLARSENNSVAIMKHIENPWLGLQFHPEVEESECGPEILEYFLTNLGRVGKTWDDEGALRFCLKELEDTHVENILCAFSGGVDSLVAAKMADMVFPGKVFCFFVDNGLLRIQDYAHIERLKEETGLKIYEIDAKDIFLSRLEGLSDPEEKRKVIGKTFIDIFDRKVKEFQADHGVKFSHLLQGTLYPDWIESHSPHGKDGASSTIKSHHNVGGLPEKLHLKLIEPLKYLFKDDVRLLGSQIDLKNEWLFRHPFPGPGLGIRILGEISPQKIEISQKADQILFEELMKNKDLYSSIWQALCVLIPQKTVGIKGDKRAYEEVICLRLVQSIDGMTCKWSRPPFDFLDIVSRRITNEVEGITRVVYDITSKPPGTIEWE